MKVFLGADHRGFEKKELLKHFLMLRGVEVFDCGNTRLDPADDYPIFAASVAEHVALHTGSRGIVLCGSGVGVTIAANKVRGIRCGLGFDVRQVASAREDDDINMLAIATDISPSDYIEQLVETFFKTPFGQTERGVRRIQQLHALERR